MKFITERSETVSYVINEGTDGKTKSYFIEGIFAQANTPNRNGRNYSQPIMEREVTKFQSSIKENRSTGELGHPDTMTVNPDKISHMITELKFEGKNDVFGKAKILESLPQGAIAAALLKEGVKLGVSTRGVGSLQQRKDGINEVQDDFFLRTIDIVSEPSGIDCWVNGIMEGAEWVFVNGHYEPRFVEQTKQTILDTPSKDLQRVCMEAFNAFLKNVK
jgi:hypothetical protein